MWSQASGTESANPYPHPFTHQFINKFILVPLEPNSEPELPADQQVLINNW